MNRAEIFVEVIAANMVTVAFLYALWRINKNENDWTAMAIVLACCLIVGVSAYAIAQPT